MSRTKRNDESFCAESLAMISLIWAQANGIIKREANMTKEGRFGFDKGPLKPSFSLSLVASHFQCQWHPKRFYWETNLIHFTQKKIYKFAFLFPSPMWANEQWIAKQLMMMRRILILVPKKMT